jgi:hypothetical protein
MAISISIKTVFQIALLFIFGWNSNINRMNRFNFIPISVEKLSVDDEKYQQLYLHCYFHIHTMYILFGYGTIR